MASCRLCKGPVAAEGMACFDCAANAARNPAPAAPAEKRSRKATSDGTGKARPVPGFPSMMPNGQYVLPPLVTETVTPKSTGPYTHDCLLYKWGPVKCPKCSRPMQHSCARLIWACHTCNEYATDEFIKDKGGVLWLRKQI